MRIVVLSESASEGPLFYPMRPWVSLNFVIRDTLGAKIQTDPLRPVSIVALLPCVLCVLSAPVSVSSVLNLSFFLYPRKPCLWQTRPPAGSPESLSRRHQHDDASVSHRSARGAAFIDPARGHCLGLPLGLTQEMSLRSFKPSCCMAKPAEAYPALRPSPLSTSPPTSELYPCVFFHLHAHSNRCAHLTNTSTINGIDKIYNLR